MAPQIFVLLPGLHTFCHRHNIQPVRQRNNDIRYRRIHAVDTDSAGKGFINFQHVRPQFFQPGERAVAGAKVIDSQVHASEMQMFRHVVIAVLKHVPLGEFNHQLLHRVGAEPEFMQIAQQFTLGKMASGDINRNVKMFIVGE